MNNNLKLLPPEVELETKRVLKQLARSHRSLAELKGSADMIPNKNILINAVTINEAKDSSEIENIITTRDEATGEIVYTPPSGEQEIISLLSNLEQYINNDYDSIDPLVQLAVIRYQFESIDPFYDGMGRMDSIYPARNRRDCR